MQFVYKAEGIEPRRWEFQPYKLMSPEAELIERRTGMAFSDWARVVTEGSMIALRALLFVLLKRTDPTLKWEQLQFSMSEVDFELDDEEKGNGIVVLEARAALGETLSDLEQDLLLTWRNDLGVELVDDIEPPEDDGIVDPPSGQGLPAPVGDNAPAPKED